jgi:lysozyme
MTDAIHDYLMRALAREEDYRQFVYLDARGLSTVAYGRNIDRRGGEGISHDEALYLLQNDIANRRAALGAFHWYAIQDDIRKSALCDMSFNLGVAGLLHFPHFLAAMDKQDYATAVSELTSSSWHTQVGARALTIEGMIQKGVWP